MSAAYAGRAWLAIGYASWEDYCDRELADLRNTRQFAGERFGMVEQLHKAGLSTRAIATGLGLAQSTVSRQVRQIAAWSGESNDSPAPIIGQDGKAYPGRESQPPPKPRELQRDFLDAVDDVRDACKCLRRAVAVLSGEGRAIEDVRALFESYVAEVREYANAIVALLREGGVTDASLDRLLDDGASA